MPARRGSSRAKPAFPPCDRTFDGQVCGKSGEHLCGPRVAHVLAFFAEILVHTKGRWARRAFHPASWQTNDIITPLFGTATWSEEAQRYVRRYRIAWIEIARKNGKSELLAAFALYLLIADDEESAEIYGCARDKDQARKVFDVAVRMVQLSLILSARLKIYNQAKRIADDRTGSYYEVLAADAAGNLGHNPHGIVFDEVLTQRDSSLWTAMRTAMGARDQPLMVAATTAGDDPQSFGKAEHDEMMRIAEDPDRAPHVFVFMRSLPSDADPWDEANWRIPNPALGEFLSLQSLREEAQEARNDPAKENAFRQFRLNQWVSQSTRWMPMHLWDSACGDLWVNPKWGYDQLAGRRAYGGVDLSAKFDLTAWCVVIPSDDPFGPVDAVWRFWLPETGLEKLDKLHDGKFTRWAAQGWITVTEGSVIDYDRVVEDIACDARHFRLVGVDADEWSMWPVINRIASAVGLDPEAGEVTAYRNTYDRLSGGMDEIMGLVRTERLQHHGNPVARFCFDMCEVRHAPYDANLVRPVKPERSSERARIDAVPTAAMAANAWKRREGAEEYVSAYETSRLMVV
jgi:phage terminase large subunit-like protein